MTRKSTRHQARGDESHRRIVEAALAIATERGYDGTSIGQVSKLAGLPVSSIYWHFRDKDDLLLAALEHALQSWRETAAGLEAMPWDGDRVSVIAGRLRGGARAMAQAPEFWRLGLMLALVHREQEPSARRRFLEVRAQTVEALVDWWEPAFPEATRRRDPHLARRFAGFHLALMDGLFLSMGADEGWDFDRLIDLAAAGLARQLDDLEEVVP